VLFVLHVCEHVYHSLDDLLKALDGYPATLTGTLVARSHHFKCFGVNFLMNVPKRPLELLQVFEHAFDAL